MKEIVNNTKHIVNDYTLEVKGPRSSFYYSGVIIVPTQCIKYSIIL